MDEEDFKFFNEELRERKKFEVQRYFTLVIDLCSCLIFSWIMYLISKPIADPYLKYLFLLNVVPFTFIANGTDKNVAGFNDHL